jgi:hypothetical protein
MGIGLLDRLAGQLDARWANLAQDVRDDSAMSKAEMAGGQQGTRYRYRRASLVDPSIPIADGSGSYGLYKPKNSPITNKLLKELSLRDPIVAAIFQTRINQVARFSRPQEDRYEPGFKIIPRDPATEVSPGSEEEQEIMWLVDFIRNCGSNEDRDPDSKMDFDTFLRLVARDRLTFAAAAIETIRNNLGGIHSFVPAPTETILHANPALPKDILEQSAQAQQMAAVRTTLGASTQVEDMLESMEIRERMRAEDEPIKFLQMIGGRVEATFTAKEMIYKLGNPQNFIENNGYCIGELEQATLTITAHLQAENYNKLFFTHGFANRGLLHIAGDISPSNLHAFRTQWYAQIAGNENSWRTPIVAGADKVEWVQLSANNREMEYSVYIDHIIRTLCSLFQISPVEIGFDYLTKGQGQGGLGQEDNEVKIEQGQVRGLKPLLVWLETLINEDILPNVSEEFAAKYKFQFVGLEAESKMEELTRQQIETQVRTTVNEARKEAGMDPVLSGDIVQAPIYVETLFRTHKIGEIREAMFDYEGDSENPEFNYIDNASYFQNLQLISQMAQQQMMMEAGGDPNADPSDPNAMDEPADGGGNPFGGGGGDAFGGEEGGDEQGGGGGEDEAQSEESPKHGSGKQKGGFGKSRRLNDNLRKAHPVIQKAVKDRLAKSAHHHHKVKKLDNDLEKMRREYHRAYREIQPKMYQEILDALKPEFDDGESE